MSTEAETPTPKRTPVEFRRTSPLVLVAFAALLVAGVLHFYVTPMHWQEAKAHGIFMATLGAVEVAVALLFVWRPTSTTVTLAILTAVASLVVWLGVTFVRVPYGDGPESPETIAYVTKVVEAIALVALVLLVLLSGATIRAAGRAVVAILLVALLLGVASGGAVYGGGLAAAKLLPSLGPTDGGSMDMSPASNNGGGGGMNMGPTSTNASGNATANATTNTTPTTNSTATNSTGKDPNMPDDPNNCMSGMDMPGCSAAQADYYYKHTKAGSAAPDRTLAPVAIELDPQGNGQSGTFTVENGTQQLLISIKIKDDGPGPWAALGPGGQGDLKIELKGSSGAKTITLNGTSQSSVGVDPASTLYKTFISDLALPSEGGWTVQVDGQGKNVQVEIDITERFYL